MVSLGWKERVGCSSEGSSEPEHDSADAPPQMEVGIATLQVKLRTAKKTTQYRATAGNAIRLQRNSGRVRFFDHCSLRKQSATGITGICQATCRTVWCSEVNLEILLSLNINCALCCLHASLCLIASFHIAVCYLDFFDQV